jgi:uncharacterized protein (TIGR02001 family)
MRTFLGCCGSFIALMAATPALADETDPPPAITITGGATLVSDYRFRGISQTDKDMAVQGTVTVAHKSGFYATFWGSSIDDYVAAGSDQELDFIVGYKKTFGSTTVDGGLLYYVYPGSRDIVAGYDSDFFEPYIAISQAIGPVTAKATVNYAPKQDALGIGFGAEDNLYTALDLSGGIPNTPVSLSAHLGHNWSKSFLSAGREYTDYGVGASVTFKAITLGVQYVDTDFPKNFVTNFITGKDVASGGVVFTLGASF